MSERPQLDLFPSPRPREAPLLSGASGSPKAGPGGVAEAPARRGAHGPPAPPPRRWPPGVRLKFREDVPRAARDVDGALAVAQQLLREAPDLTQIQLTVNANRRRVLSWRTHGERIELSVHHQAVAQPGQVAAVVLRRDAAAWRSLCATFEPTAPARAVEVRPEGRVHDLRPLFHDTNRALLDGRLALGPALAIGWGSWPTVAPRRGLRLGSCGGVPTVIRVHPCLDHRGVPSWFVGFVLYHEMLHVLIPPRAGSGSRRVVHPPEFRALERRHPRYDEALAWERENLPALIRRAGAGRP